MNDANDIVNEEIHRLDHNADAAFETVNARFQTVLDNVERRRQEVIIRAIFLNIAKTKIMYADGIFCNFFNCMLHFHDSTADC